MIPLTSTVTISFTSVDEWGVNTSSGLTEAYKCYLSYKLGQKGAEINSNNPTLEVVPSGTIFFKGLVKITHHDDISWTGFDGRKYRANPENIDYILDSTGKVTYTKVTF